MFLISLAPNKTQTNVPTVSRYIDDYFKLFKKQNMIESKDKMVNLFFIFVRFPTVLPSVVQK